MTYLNVNVLFARILNKEGKGILPHGTVGPIAGLQRRGGKLFIMLRVRFNILREDYFITLLSLVASCIEICTIGLGSLFPFLIYNT